MADVVMPKSVPCQFDKHGWAPCRKPSTNGFCSKHEKVRCTSCKEHAVKTCDSQMGGLACGANLCLDCHHSKEAGGSHVIGEVYAVQMQEFLEFLKTEKESKRMLALRGVPTDVEFPRHLQELLAGDRADFDLKMCYYLTIKHTLMGSFPAILKGTEIPVITAEKSAIFQIWESLEPRDSELIESAWMVHKSASVGYRMFPDKIFQKESRPQKLFTSGEIEAHFRRTAKPFVWVPGLVGAQISLERFRELIRNNQ